MCRSSILLIAFDPRPRLPHHNWLEAHLDTISVAATLDEDHSALSYVRRHVEHHAAVGYAG